MRRLYYRPKRLQKNPAGPNRPDQVRRRLALFLCACIILAMVPKIAFAVNGYAVRFVNYDLSELVIGPFSGVPEGTKLCTTEELVDVEGFTEVEGSTWYLYLEGGEGVGYGPIAIADPPAREGYTFRDWAAQGAADSTLHTVTGDTTFVARYVSDSQFVVNLYYQFDNDENTVAAETTTTPYGQNETISMALPSTEALSGLNPQILTHSGDGSIQEAVNALNGMIQGGVFTGPLDDAFLENCRTAGYVAWDDTANDYLKDENSNVQISIPVTYVVTGTITFWVEYWQQNADDDGYTYAGGKEGSVEGTTRVSLKDLGLVEQYEGFSLTTASSEDADSYTVSADSSSPTTIKLYYDRDIHYLYYEMNGGNAVEPVALRYGQSISSELTADSLAVRTGYNFSSWIWLDEDGTAMTGAPSAMPNHDLTLRANWEGTNTTVTLVYWLENANDDNYTVAGQRTISVTSGQTVGYEHPDHQGEADVSINDYLSADAMKIAGIDDGEYFTFASADSSTAIAPGAEGELKTAAGDGSTVINIGYTRNEYTLVFHLGKQDVGDDGTMWSYISIRGFSGEPGASALAPWLGGSFEWSAGGKQAILTINEKEYTIGENNDDSACYQITAKYGAFISDLWPTTGNDANDAVITSVTQGNQTYQLFTWGTNYQSPYYKARYSVEKGGNPNIIGVYPTMSDELIIEPTDPSVKHHLVAYWNNSSNHKTHHYLFEVVPGVDTTDKKSYEYNDFIQGNYTGVNTQGAQQTEKLEGKTFYEINAPEVYTNQTSDNQNAPAFSNLTYQYGCYPNGTNKEGSGDVYFFYTYNNYTLTYHENNANLTPGQEQGAKTQEVPFHYVDGKPVADLIERPGWDADYTPSQPFVSSYGNEYEFIGWYTSNLTEDATDNERFRIDWTTFAPSSSVNIYAAWKAPSFTLTLVVPDGTLYPDSLEQFDAKGYTVEILENQPAGGTTYVVSGIPGGTRASEIVRERHGAQNAYSLAFDYWSYQVGGREQQYLFSESQLVTSDLILTARWKTEYTGQYIVRYLTTEPQNNNLGTVTIDGTEYYRLQADKTVTGVAVGSSVSEAAAVANGYLSAVGEITKVVEAPENQMVKTYFDFFYAKITGPVTYTVHYVLDSGTDYGRTAPPDDVVRLAADKTVSVDMASLNQSTTVSEAAVVVGGYTPRDSWNISFTLSGSSGQNHLYIYYVSNTYEVQFCATYHFMDDSGKYSSDAAYTFLLEAWDALGKTIYARNLVENYGQYLEDTGELATLEEMMAGHILDTVTTSSLSILLTRQTGTEPAQTVNVIHIYMKNADYTVTYRLNDGGDQNFPASWPDADAFLDVADDATVYFQTVTYPAGASVPTSTPARLSYTFAGWNAAADGTGTDYPADGLKDAPWYREKGLTSDVTLYARWEKQLVVTFDLRSGGWTDTGGDFRHVGGDLWEGYVHADGTAPRPADPRWVLEDGTAYSFIGWTTTDPDSEEWNFIDGQNRVDLDIFYTNHRYDFTQPVTEPITLYAVWDPDVTTFEIVKTDTDTENPTYLADSSFTLERLKATVSGDPASGYTYTLVTDDSGGYVADPSFVLRSLTTDEAGRGAFENLPAGYYRLTETAPPAGYVGLAEPVILFAPYGDGPPHIVSPTGNSAVTGTADDAGLTIQVRNVSQYNVTITAPDSLTLTYTPPDIIWNPETLEYEGISGSEGGWIVSTPTGQEAVVTVTNNSLSADVQAEVSLQYDAAYQILLPLSTLTAEPSGSFSYEAGTGILTGILTAPASASFCLSVNGTLPPDVLLPAQETPAGTLTIRITKPGG